MIFFEDVCVGDKLDVGRYTFTAESIKSFAARFDPQPFHLDEGAAERSHFGRLCASGWHTACVWMRLMIDHRRREDEERRARGEAVGQLGPSPGFRDLEWLKPVYVGDTISYGTEVVEMRPLASRPGWGMIFVRNTGVNQRGERVISFISSAFVERRERDPQVS
ncbi:MAG TPA: MaoC family dehydratase [Xanthobacteraceae bacterium]|nr:MaoC family dehydratase [Xanthobacteraceae bacterium]